MSISTELVLAVIAAGSTVAVAIFQGAFYLGQIWHRIGRAEGRIDDLERDVRVLKDAA
jgi:hypothetical protein